MSEAKKGSKLDEINLTDHKSVLLLNLSAFLCLQTQGIKIGSIILKLLVRLSENYELSQKNNI